MPGLGSEPSPHTAIFCSYWAGKVWGVPASRYLWVLSSRGARCAWWRRTCGSGQEMKPISSSFFASPEFLVKLSLRVILGESTVSHGVCSPLPSKLRDAAAHPEGLGPAKQTNKQKDK